MKKFTTIILLLCMSASLMQAQITIGGSVYGGGNAGDLGGKTKVSIYAGDIHQVYGGARQANVGGSTFVHIDGEHAVENSYIVIDKVYGGNDIAGTIGTSSAVPEQLTQADENQITNEWNSFVRLSTKMTTNAQSEQVPDETQKTYIGQLFGGGNGEYDYTSENSPYKGMVKPEMNRTYLEILGGSIVYAYGGGNNATVKEKTVICVDNPSKVVNSIVDINNKHIHANTTTGELLTPDRFRLDMGINTGFSHPSSDEFQIGRFFGGNNKAEMAIQPTWNLKSGLIRNLYSGGNQGAMTSPNGLLIYITAESKIVIDNLFGGCRMADVKPSVNGVYTPVVNNTQFTTIPNELSARLVVRGGDVNNVYGGNDITGRVWGGSAIGIGTSIRGDVYGGGNGSYPYTDNLKLKDNDIYGDLYYTIPAGKTSVEALNDYRPNIEQVSIRLYGSSADNPTLIRGSVYCGGNSATIKSDKLKPRIELKIGSYVIADEVFLGNNGANMIKYNEGTNAFDQGVLYTMKRTDLTGDGSPFSSLVLTGKNQFATYMQGCAMDKMPSVVFDADYDDYSSYFGSFYCGGNVGSMTSTGKTSLSFDDKAIIFDKVVGGCNDAVVKQSDYNALYTGGLINDADANGDKVELNFNGLLIEPKRWNSDKSALVWNTIDERTGAEVATPTNTGIADDDDMYRRLTGGNVYGGCYNSGVVNGNVVININGHMVDRDMVFDHISEPEVEHYAYEHYTITQRKSGVLLSEQGMDVLGTSMNVFGGGFGKDTEIWGKATVNLNRGYIFQIFGGSEKGVIGKSREDKGETAQTGDYIFNGEHYAYDANYSTYVNLKGPIAGVPKADNMTEDMAECEFLYGGGFVGPVAGNCIVNLDNGRIFDSFSGACMADVLGHTETYVGLNGFPYVRDYVFGGNDLGGRIIGEANFDSRLRNQAVRDKVSNTNMLNASAYIEYVQGHSTKIFGGAYGVYDYKDAHYREFFDENGHAKEGYSKPFLGNAFINFRPIDSNNELNTVRHIYGAGQGITGEEEMNKFQNSSYILIDVPQTMQTYQNTEIFGAGECGGVGMGVEKAVADNAETAYKASAIIDLMSGHFQAVYGGSYQEGVTRRTVINVPGGSTFRAQNIFGGAYGLIEEDGTVHNDVPCDVYEAIVNYNSNDATIDQAIYGGNNNCRRTLYGTVNINSTVWSDKSKGYTATVYGAGLGEHSWSQYTEVNLNNGASVDQAYGGGKLGKVISKPSVVAWKAYMQAQAEAHAQDPTKPEPEFETLPLDLENGYTDNGLLNDLAKSNKLHEVDATRPEKYNTNVRIKAGATVGRYCYGGGLGDDAVPGGGDVYGTTYVELLGGTVKRDLYAAGTTGAVYDRNGGLTNDFGNPFIASTTAYIEGGTARNVYGGGWKGSVGNHQGDITTSYASDIPGETHVIIGKLDGTDYVNGLPAIERNAYGGGEGGAVFGTTNITMYNGFIGYRHFDGVPPTDTDLDYIQVGSDYYQEKLHDETWNGDGTGRLNDSGCIFGGGYIDNSSVDITNVKMYGGNVRNALFGGGEIAAIGRGVITASGENNSVRSLQGIYKAGKTHVTLYSGHVWRNVFGGGRGYNNLGEGGTLYSDGYVFGQTEVNIHGGEIGSDKGIELGYGNVFGGGDIGYVYSAYEDANKKLHVGIKDGERYTTEYEGYYYDYITDNNFFNPSGFVIDADDPNWVKDNNEFVLTEDCKVLVEPHTKALSAVNVNNHSYNEGDYVPTTDLNMLGNKTDPTWNSLDGFGIIIHNAVFAGGNTSPGSATVFANVPTVFGNATASVHDVYHLDLITLGTGRLGGLYGDGNLTFVDGYRGLNITNYGTDYYSIAKEISIDQYRALPDREKAYYELRYLCVNQCTDNEGTTYYPAGGDHTKASTLTADEIYTLFKNMETTYPTMFNTDGSINTDKDNEAYWEENGVCSIYAGRLMNTIQRADFCGVFGSRMVMKGAQDRVPEIVDYTNYTINRVREVSLNQIHSKIQEDLALNAEATPAAKPEDQLPTDFADQNKAVHGNYFGIYSIVNYLGALTSDVHFREDADIRITDNSDTGTYGSTGTDDNTYYKWKRKHINERKRNNGNSLNKVALASGVYLELTTEKSTGTDLYEKDWGYITGVIELDLINVQTGMGGGFVYAKNEHRVGTYNKKYHTTLTALNADAITRKDFDYEGGELVEWETSGNFVHSTQTIIDDCYNVSGKYGEGGVPAHYWFIKGQVYVYDQYISAYTGAPNAYSESVEIPLTITAASHGSMKLLNVMPNRYAYFKSNGVPLENDQKLVINDVTYYKNDPISYWDWYLLTKSEQALFVEDTYVTTADCKWSENDTDVIPAGKVMLSTDYTSLKTAHPKVYHVGLAKEVDFDFVFRSSNNVSHNTGYLLTYKVTNPKEWNTWYTKQEGNEKQQTYATGYDDGPTYHLTGSTGGVFGQMAYEESNIISKTVYDTYQNVKKNHASAIPAAGQATFEDAYLVTKEYAVGDKHLNIGATVSATAAASMTGYVAPAFICTRTIQLSPTEFIYVNTKMTEAEKTAYYDRFKDDRPDIAADILADIVPAYYCVTAGKYGGDYYEPGKNYRGLEVWCSMSKADREQFAFNYDALDLLIDPNYSRNAQGAFIHPEGQKYQYDSSLGTLEGAEANSAGYSLEQAVDYSATYHGSATSTHNGVKLENGKEYSRTDFEKLPNEKRHYAPIDVKDENDVYVVNTGFQIGNTPYAVGTTISKSTYDGLGSDQQYVTELTFTDAQKNKTFYYCREEYKVNENDEGVSVTNADVTGSATGTYNNGQTVPVGLVITSDKYSELANCQLGFTIHGIAPTETATLYVSRNSDIFDLSKEKIITVVYEYSYEESDVNGTHVTPVSERHVVNIHLEFKSGIPTVEDIKVPQIVLPGTYVGLREPNVTPGAYEITGGGWELFEKIGEAESHTNGKEYIPNFDPLYWYQDGYYVAYYAKTYLGKTYSNAVQVSVANYHDLTKVLGDTEHHYYVDNKNVKRNSKIYITDATNGATQLKDFFDLSKSTLDEHVRNCQNLEFIMHTNVSHTGEWTSIGDNTNCFSGNLHGDGYHIDGLDHSLFGSLCGNIYNLGVTGSFTSAGIADTGSGYVENCWINTTGTPASGVKAVFGTPTASGYKRVNCFYPDNLNYSKEDDGHGLAHAIPYAAFHNGTAAYDLNGFYLFKRYNDKKTTSGTDYTYYTIKEDDGTLERHDNGGHYIESPVHCSAGVDGVYAYGGYVEDRYADGDYRYGDGNIPEGEDERMHIDAEEKVHFYPIWPDDYLFFGQMLTYGYNDSRPHEETPSHLLKSDGRLSRSDDSNRVLRAPAYYQSSEMGVAHFNTTANLTAYPKPGSVDDITKHPGYPNMTAIDFAGHGDTEYKLGLNNKWFYQPLLDDDGLIGIANRDETPNLLVYAPSAGANTNTYNVLTAYFKEPAYSDYYDSSDPYRRVLSAPTWTVFGHLVTNDFKATNDHLLVDRKDFNCPMSYQFVNDKRMWYQRTPEHFVALTKGWSGVSLPFTAELVSTQDKGEITHFYSGSEDIDNNGTKIGNEYWLREYKGKKEETGDTFTAAFNYPAKTGREDDNKQVNNTFLWDYYYSKNHIEGDKAGQDANDDTYQTRYKTGRTLTQYPLVATAKPYIVGFPGKTYYEFDLSGEFVAQHTATPAPDRLDKQNISFVSVPNIIIAVSDDELTASAVDGYKFMPNYMSKVVNGYLMNTDGNSFDATPAVGAKAIPFRPYFMAGSPNQAPAKRAIKSILFDSSDSSFAIGDDDPSDELAGELTFSTKPRKLVVASSMRQPADVRIYSVSGQSIAAFTIQTGETIETDIPIAGVYVVRAANGRYTKKFVLK